MGRAAVSAAPGSQAGDSTEIMGRGFGALSQGRAAAPARSMHEPRATSASGPRILLVRTGTKPTKLSPQQRLAEGTTSNPGVLQG